MANGIHGKTDVELKSLLDVMASKAPALQAQLQLTAQQVQEIQDASTEFDQALESADNTLTKYRAAVQGKDTVREQATELLSQLINIWKYNESVSNESLAEVGVSRDQKKRQVVPVYTPAMLQVRTDNTVNTLTWDPNGNEYRTVYKIEYRFSTTEPWALLDVTTKTKYRHTGRTPGERVYYRVSAQRSDRSSGPTAPVGAYLDDVAAKAA